MAYYVFVQTDWSLGMTFHFYLERNSDIDSMHCGVYCSCKNNWYFTWIYSI